MTVAGQDAPELFALITDLLDHAAYPAEVLAAAYHWRWIGSETCLKEAKSAISGAGPSTRANRHAILAGLARRRVDVDRNRHRDRKTKARPGFPPGGPRIPILTAEAEISVCGHIAA